MHCGDRLLICWLAFVVLNRVLGMIMTEADSGLLPHLKHLFMGPWFYIWQSHARQYLTGDFSRPDDGARPADSAPHDSDQQTIADGIHESGTLPGVLPMVGSSVSNAVSSH